MEKEVKVTRFIKDSIRSMRWELQINEYDGKYSIRKSHVPKDGGDFINTTEELVTKGAADKFLEKNKNYIIEVYERASDPEYDKIFI